MREIIATIRLAPGEVGFYDEYTGIHLTVSKPEAAVFSGMNLAQLRTSVKSGRLLLKSGSLSAPAKPVEMPAKPEAEMVEVVPVIEAPAPAPVEVVVEETAETAETTEEVAEIVAEMDELAEMGPEAAEFAEEVLELEAKETAGKKKKANRTS